MKKAQTLCKSDFLIRFLEEKISEKLNYATYFNKNKKEFKGKYALHTLNTPLFHFVLHNQKAKVPGEGQRRSGSGESGGW